MKLFARVVDVPADALAVARALRREPGFSFLWDAGGDEPATIACWPLAVSAELDPEETLGMDPALGPLGAAPRWLGTLPYEARRTLERPRYARAPEDRPEPLLGRVVWRRYGAVVRVARDVTVVGDDAAAVRELSSRVRVSVTSALRRPDAREPASLELLPSEADEAHAARIRRALDHILRGDVYQINLARRFDFRVEGSALGLLEHMVGRSRVPFAAAFEDGSSRVAVASPELFLSVSPDGRLTTRPIKGTRPRGADRASDHRLREELDASDKERAELSMVVDVERNDLGRIARTGSVRLLGPPSVDTWPTVHHRAATVAAWLRPGVGRRAVLEAMLPSGSVTGAPKIRAMELISELESARRGLYTGAFGALSHDGSLRLGMAIRALLAEGSVGHYFAGGGIVYGSDPEREVEETRWKAVSVLRQSWPADRAPGKLAEWTR